MQASAASSCVPSRNRRADELNNATGMQLFEEQRGGHDIDAVTFQSVFPRIDDDTPPDLAAAFLEERPQAACP